MNYPDIQKDNNNYRRLNVRKDYNCMQKDQYKYQIQLNQKTIDRVKNYFK